MYWKECKSCRLDNSKVVFPEKNRDPEITLVGEAPGKDEEIAGKPFVGKSGKLLNSCLEKAGIDRKTCLLMNTVLCRPIDNKIKSSEITSCHTVSRKYIHAQPTNVYVALGATAYKYLFKVFNPRKKLPANLSLTRVRGQVLNYDDAIVIPTWHPAYALPGYRNTQERANQIKEQIITDLRLAKTLHAGHKLKTNDNYKIVGSIEQAKQAINYYKSQPVFAYDTETTGLKYDSIMLGLSLSCKFNEAVYIPMYEYNKKAGKLLLAKYLHGDGALELLEAKLRDLFSSDTPKIGHNLKFDGYIIRHNLGVWPKAHVYDTQIAAFVENTEEYPNLKLEDLISQYCPEILVLKQSLNVEKSKSSKEAGFTHVEPQKLAAYACGDADATFRIAVMTKGKLLSRPNDLKFLTEELMPTCDALSKAYYKGVKVDVKLATEYQKLFNDEAIKTQQTVLDFARIHNMPNFNPRSYKQKIELFIDKLKLPVYNYTATGNAQTDKKTIYRWLIDPEITEKQPEVTKVLTSLLHLSRVQRLQTNYIEGTLKRLDNDGCIRTNYNQTIARTYRLTSSGPNLQNLPRGDDYWAKKIKQIFVARPGYKFIGSDLSQAELRVAAVLSGDENMLRIFREKIDPHATTASDRFGVKLSKVTAEERATGKTVNFAVMYDTTAPTLRFTLCFPTGSLSVDQIVAQLPEIIRLLKIHTVETCQGHINSFFSTYPGIKEYTREQVRRCKIDGYVETYFGGRRYIPGINSTDHKVAAHAARQAFNTPIQGTAALLTTRAFHTLDRKLDPNIAYPLLTVHDWNGIECREDKVDEYKEIVYNTMTAPYKDLGVKVPIEADLEVTSRWKDLDV